MQNDKNLSNNNSPKFPKPLKNPHNKPPIFSPLINSPFQSTLPASFVFTHFYNTTNISNPFYLFSVGFLVSIFTVNGFDSAGQICSEIPNAEDNCPKAIIRSLALSIAGGFIVLMSILFHLGGKDDHYIQSLIDSQNIII